MPDALLSVRGLSLALPDLARRPLFGRAPMRGILHDIDLHVAAGECIGLVGESGSGKTTLARTVLRLHEPQAGDILFAGREVTHMGETELRPLRARLQMIFQDPLSALNPRHRVGEIIVQPLLAYGRLGPSPTASERRDRAFELLAQVSLPAEFAERFPHELSGGQRQRVGIARAIALAPDLIVADEIVSGLDVSTQARILTLLRDLRQRLGLAMIFVTHDLSVVRVLCDRVIVLREGRIVEQGATQAVFEQPRHAYTRALLDAIPLPEIDDTWLLRAKAPAP
jgi:ABC-type oligopeptide transport system ATPase subunit